MTKLKKCKHEWRFVRYNSNGYNYIFYCINCLELTERTL